MSVVGLFIGPKKSFVRILLTRKSGHSAAVSMGGAKPTAEALISLKLWVQDDLEVSALLKQFTILWLSRWVEMRLSSQYDYIFFLFTCSNTFNSLSRSTHIFRTYVLCGGGWNLAMAHVQIWRDFWGPDFSYNIRVESHPSRLLSKKTSWQILTQSLCMQTAYVSC